MQEKYTDATDDVFLGGSLDGSVRWRVQVNMSQQKDGFLKICSRFGETELILYISLLTAEITEW